MDHFTNIRFWPKQIPYLKMWSVPSESLIGILNVCTIYGRGKFTFAQTIILGLF